MTTIFVLFISVCYTAESETPTASEFVNVPNDAKPWVYYWWLKGNVTKEQITHDLEEMQQKGIGGILLFDSRGYYDEFDSKDHVPVPLKIKYEFMSPQWREMVKHTINEAARCHLKVSINIANTGGHLRGVWDMKENGPKELIWSVYPVNHLNNNSNNNNNNNNNKITLKLPIPDEKPYYQDVAVLGVRLTLQKTGVFQKVVPINETSPVVTEIIDLTNNVKNHQLEWNAPDGNWYVLRFGYEIVGDFGSVDILNAKACTQYFHLIGSELIKDAGEHTGKTLTHFYNVSWEGSSPNWTQEFDKIFWDQNGYDLKQYLPVLAGMIVENAEVSKRFLYDYYKTIAYCFQKNCYANIGRLCHENGIIWHSENGGPWNRQQPMFREADMLSFFGENDFAQGEFWVNETNYGTRSNMRYVSMASHIYGQKEVAVEAFTHMVRHWTMYPARLKPAADVNFIDGANKFIWHTFTASPPELGKPGYEYFAGTHINTNVTWWNYVTPFMNYLGRCQYLLRQGLFAADACVYVSDKNYTAWGRSEKWNPNSSLVLPAGYTYDLLDTEILVHRLTCQDGKLVLPNGMCYRFLVLDPLEEVLPVEALKKIVQLTSEGATIILGNKRTIQTPSLKNYPSCDQEIADLANQLWGTQASENQSPELQPLGTNTDTNKTFRHSLGHGTIFKGISLQQFLQEQQIDPDFSGSFEYHHRKLKDKDIYFISGNGNADCIFRVSGREPKLWDAVTGKITVPLAYSFTQDGRTKVTINLAAFGSVFVVFDGTPDKNYITEIADTKIGLEVNEQSIWTQWKSGSYRLTTASGKQTEWTADLPPAIELQKSWEVRFDPVRGKQEKVIFDQLTLWNEHSDPAIRYYSGTAIYRNTFSLNEKQIGIPTRLSIGAAHHIAKVKLNGEELGILWTAPRSVDIASACRLGENVLEIEVTNCWANRLIGDAGLPPEKRLTRTNLYLIPERKTNERTYKLYQGFSAKDTLLPSGLLSPVLIEFGKTQKLPQ
ncbi:MAG: hypothetical protein LBE12_00880 [Planctomycetaceae bacterium]|nr:hypothetical protein [Planctomycetaceae bacterium]